MLFSLGIKQTVRSQQNYGAYSDTGMHTFYTLGHITNKVEHTPQPRK